ncbi:MAG: C40 family peptidase [Patescibacteria group bacterium]
MTRQLTHHVTKKMTTGLPTLSSRQNFFWGKINRQVANIFRKPIANFDQLTVRALARNRQTQTTAGDLPFKFWPKDENWRSQPKPERSKGVDWSLIQLADQTFGWLPNQYIVKQKSANYWEKIKLAPKNKLTPLLCPTPAKFKKILNQFKGVPYLWGGTTKAGMDCSAFTQKLFFELGGILLPRNSREQKKCGRAVDSTKSCLHAVARRAKACPLDLLFFVHSTTGRHHVGVYWNDAVVYTRRSPQGEVWHFCLDKRGLSTESLDSMQKRYNHVATRRIFKLRNA